MFEGLTAGAALYLEWLLDERPTTGVVKFNPDGTIAEDSESKGSAKDFAESIGFTERTIYRWRKDTAFQRAYRMEVEKELRDPTHMLDVIRSVRNQAINGEGKEALSAADLYSRLTNYQAPKPLKETRKASELTDEELAAAVAAQTVVG